MIVNNLLLVAQELIHNLPWLGYVDLNDFLEDAVRLRLEELLPLAAGCVEAQVVRKVSC